MGSSILPLIVIAVLFSGLPLSLSQPVFSCFNCSSTHGNYTSNSTFKTNLGTLLTTITSNTEIDYGFYNFSVGHNSDKVYGIGVCRADLTVSDCRNCLNDAALELPGICPTQKEAMGYFAGRCMLRYSDRSIFKIVDDSPSCHPALVDYIPGSAYSIRGPDGKKFNQTLGILLQELKEKAAAGGSRHKFATGAANVTASLKIYALTQCNPDLSSLNCSTCLQSLIRKLPSYFYGTKGAGIYGPSCSVEFETSPFFNLASPTPHPLVPSSTARGKRREMQKVWIVVVLLVLFVLLAPLSFRFLYKRKRKTQKEVERRDEIKCVDSLQFEYNVIEAATDNFSDVKRLGKGTSTNVYKGTLPGGQEIVVKRMFHGGEDSELEFNNEVLLLANLQHRNLVRLLGFCIKKDVRLLTYEYLPNESLSQILCDPTKCAQLDWETRHKIILGIARGLLYLHEDSQLRVVHRDLKASNILLDVEMNPKISNFSKASRVHVDEPKEGSSKIKGTYTYGYMAPEYVLQGHFSIKSDVFSFGVLLLEIINGQTLSNFSAGDNGESLVSFAWRKWYKGEALDVMDKTMQRTESYTTQILKCIKIALLCVQEDPTSRPTMSAVVYMLNSNIDTIIAEPSRPAFRFDNARDPSSSDYSGRSNQGSVNEASISGLEPR